MDGDLHRSKSKLSEGENLQTCLNIDPPLLAIHNGGPCRVVYLSQHPIINWGGAILGVAEGWYSVKSQSGLSSMSVDSKTTD